jgi:hypothetical protein
MDGDDEFVRWLTYAQLAESRGISKASATRMAFRYKWRRQVGNDHVTRVAVPVGQDKPPEVPVRVAKQDDTRDGATPGAMDWQDAVSSLTEARNQAEERADEAKKRSDVAIALADRTLVQLAEANARADQADRRADQAEKRADQAWSLVERWAASEKEARRELVVAQGDVQRLREAADRHQQAIAPLEAAQAEAQQRAREAEATAEELREADAARRGQGLWPRLKAAWRGE